MRRSSALGRERGRVVVTLHVFFFFFFFFFPYSETATAQVPPNERYLAFKTEHFRVVFPEGMESC
jgi:hypothetical protein